MNITLTGLDRNTDLTKLPNKKCCEYGILYTEDPEDRNRYPTWDIIYSILHDLKGYNLALHVCGKGARNQLKNFGLSPLTNCVHRIQINGKLTKEEVEFFCRAYPRHTIITQHNSSNDDLTDLKIDNHAYLIDASDGRGLSPDTWNHKFDFDINYGFAGGLGPDNLEQEMIKIEEYAGTRTWVDMENKLRTDDWFDVDKAKQVLDIFF